MLAWRDRLVLWELDELDCLVLWELDASMTRSIGFTLAWRARLVALWDLDAIAWRARLVAFWELNDWRARLILCEFDAILTRWICFWDRLFLWELYELDCLVLWEHDATLTS